MLEDRLSVKIEPLENSLPYLIKSACIFLKALS